MDLYHLPLQMDTRLIQTGTPLNRSVMLKFGGDRQGAKRQSFYRRALKPGSRFVQCRLIDGFKKLRSPIHCLMFRLRCILSGRLPNKASRGSIAHSGAFSRRAFRQFYFRLFRFFRFGRKTNPIIYVGQFERCSQSKAATSLPRYR